MNLRARIFFKKDETNEYRTIQTSFAFQTRSGSRAAFMDDLEKLFFTSIPQGYSLIRDIRCEEWLKTIVITAIIVKAEDESNNCKTHIFQKWLDRTTVIALKRHIPQYFRFCHSLRLLCRATGGNVSFSKTCEGLTYSDQFFELHRTKLSALQTMFPRGFAWGAATAAYQIEGIATTQ